MPNDAKMALVIGIGLVIAVAVVFFHKDLVPSHPSEDRPPVNVGNPPPAGPGYPPRRTVPARPTARISGTTGARKHTVAAGETLYELAQRYYGDGERFVQLYDGNRDVLERPDRLEAGTVLVIPDLPETPDR